MTKGEEFRSAIINVMPPKGTTPNSKFISDADFNRILQWHSKLVIDVCTFMARPHLRGNFLQGIRGTTAEDLSLPILANVKTHKAKGNVKRRVIHSGASFLFTDISLLLVTQIELILVDFPHLLPDTVAERSECAASFFPEGEHRHLPFEHPVRTV